MLSQASLNAHGGPHITTSIVCVYIVKIIFIFPVHCTGFCHVTVTFYARESARSSSILATAVKSESLLDTPYFLP